MKKELPIQLSEIGNELKNFKISHRKWIQTFTNQQAAFFDIHGLVSDIQTKIKTRETNLNRNKLYLKNTQGLKKKITVSQGEVDHTHK